MQHQGCRNWCIPNLNISRQKHVTMSVLNKTKKPEAVHISSHMEVSWNGGTPSHHPFWIGIFYEINHPFLGYPHFRKSSYLHTLLVHDNISCPSTHILPYRTLDGLVFICGDSGYEKTKTSRQWIPSTNLPKKKAAVWIFYIILWHSLIF